MFYYLFFCKDRRHEAMRILENLKTHPDIGLGAMVALLHAHKKFANQNDTRGNDDYDRKPAAVDELDRKVKETRKRADEKVCEIRLN